MLVGGIHGQVDCRVFIGMRADVVIVFPVGRRARGGGATPLLLCAAAGLQGDLRIAFMSMV